MRKIINFFLKMLCVMILMVGTLALLESEAVNGLVCTLITAVLIVLLIKLPASLAIPFTCIASIILIYIGVGPNKYFFEMAGLIVGFLIFDAYLKRRSKIDLVVAQHHANGKECCPHCGSTRVHFEQGYTEYGSEAAMDEVAYNGDLHDVRYTKVNTTHHKGHWRCSACGKTF